MSCGAPMAMISFMEIYLAKSNRIRQKRIEVETVREQAEMIIYTVVKAMILFMEGKDLTHILI